MSISLKRKKIFQKEKPHSSVFWKAFQISRKYFSCHMHFNRWPLNRGQTVYHNHVIYSLWRNAYNSCFNNTATQRNKLHYLYFSRVAQQHSFRHCCVGLKLTQKMHFCVTFPMFNRVVRVQQQQQLDCNFQKSTQRQRIWKGVVKAVYYYIWKWNSSMLFIDLFIKIVVTMNFAFSWIPLPTGQLRSPWSVV